jgi:hypothetical protein
MTIPTELSVDRLTEINKFIEGPTGNTEWEPNFEDEAIQALKDQRDHIDAQAARIAGLERAGSAAASSATDWEMKFKRADLILTALTAAGFKVLKDTTHAERSWSEDRDHENGNYTCKCMVCLREFTGYKRRTVCVACFAAPSGGGEAMTPLERAARECLAYGDCPPLSPMSGITRCANCPRTKANKLKALTAAEIPLDEKISRWIAIENGDEPDQVAGWAAVYPIWHQHQANVRSVLKVLTAIATPEAIPDAAVEAAFKAYFDNDPETHGYMIVYLPHFRRAIAAALRVIADSKADTTSPICPPNNGEPVTKS